MVISPFNLMNKRNIVVLGASAGGFEAIKKIVAGLPADFDASLFIVWHMSPDVRGILPEVLNKLGKLPAAHAMDREPIKSRRIYVAPPDCHLLLEDGYVRITKGPKEHRFRPAVDPLFRSAAYRYGARVIGIILSGALDDGTAGLWAVKENGGIAIVQAPQDAEVPSMPQNALNAVKVDFTLPVRDVPELLIKLAAELVQSPTETESKNDKTALEIKIAMDEEQLEGSVMKYGTLSPYTCPDCHGVLTSLSEGNSIRFRCHTGHAFSAGSLLAAIGEGVEENLWSAVRNIRESALFLNHLGDHFAEKNQPKLAAMYFKKANEAQARAEKIREAIAFNAQQSTFTIKQQAENEGPDAPA
jgi:two-component system, chemotaxis family, protein-glutamate methylesterase/glutaminase